MDPVTAGLVLATEALRLIGKIIDITPPEMHQKNFERWDRFLDRAEALLEKTK